MHVIPSRDFRRMPWRNGGGETIEIAIAPPGASLDAFDWRVSMAHVASDGPFSLFPGVDRTLAVLSGNGIALAIDGAAPLVVTRDSPPRSFPGDVSCDARLVGGPITDLNVMTRRGRYTHRLTRHAVAGEWLMRTAASTLVLICTDATVDVTCESGQVRVAAGDALIVDTPSSELRAMVHAPANVYAAEFTAA